MTVSSNFDTAETLRRLHADGYVVLENILPRATTTQLRERIERLLVKEREQAFADESTLAENSRGAHDFLPGMWNVSDQERAIWMRRVREQERHEFDTPWPVPDAEVCINFLHLPTFFDEGRSQRVFNLINKDLAFAPLIEHPVALETVDAEVGRDAVLLDVSINHVGAHTDSGGWHVDSPISQLPAPFPDFTLSVQSVWMLDDFTEANGATHVVRGSHRTLHGPPKGSSPLNDEVVLEAPAGSLAIWLSQTWHRHGANMTDTPRCGLISQYGRAWVKPFVDLRTPITAEQARQLSPRLRYMMGCNASPPVRG